MAQSPINIVYSTEVHPTVLLPSFGHLTYVVEKTLEEAKVDATVEWEILKRMNSHEPTIALSLTDGATDKSVRGGFELRELKDEPMFVLAVRSLVMELARMTR